ncbi:fatty acid synthase subunit alpha [Aspergillus saccharolyticus JOP 1030-1]|uniref:Fatty acid synthase subunit alpha n=1 Tax=Aspergillus saccharolyticus JOP 1030-1 TaxID=1450539 RepID=A0A318ZMA5_9EURO|nr:fatty acid synthase subunit alpha [Aspergillus saccharolyticus JOP 1030-1]PYH48719.1 fatty acid synthase subunit alpha [Aspergillus saccharolyticus JOP 1030-1]
MAVDTDAQRKLARILLIELMASQFASPVRWIETQDVILSNQECDKIVEIGPSTTLVGMFQRTVTSAQYKTQESTRVKSRKLWSSERDTKDIYYEHTPAAPEVNPKQVTQTEINSSTVSPPVETRIEPAVVPVANSELATPKPAPIELEDVAVPVRDIVTTILSRALKKAPSEIDETKSIKALAGGRSTLENEIVGDLQAEFGSLPERAEDAPLSEAWQAIQSHHAGTLGKVSTALINLLFTSKFPSGFTTAVVRDRLNSQWGLKQGRQDSCLLLAVTTQPATRMATESDAKTFMDSVVETYASREGITLGPSHPAGDGGSAPSVMLDSEAARALSESQKALSRQLLDLYAAHAGLDLGEDRRALNTLRRDIETKLQAELDFWAEELGSDYTNGIQPRFDARKVRSYDSAWNWARQRLLELFDLATSAQRGDNIAFDRTSVLQSCYAIANAADQTLIPVLNEMLTKLSDTALRSIFMNLEAYCKHTVEFGPLLKGPPRQLAPRTTVAEDGKIEYMEKERDGGVSFADLAIPTSEEDGLVPFLHLREKQADGWRYSRTLTTQLHDALTRLEGEGSSFSGQTVLITGAGIGSIGAAMIELFLHGGARVIVTSSSLSPETARKYQSIYMDHGAKGSQLIVVPFNQASVQDVASLVEYVYSPSGLDCDVDYLIPFAAISETGRKLDSIDSKSELAHRLMLTNVLRLLGTLKTYKEKSHYDTKPAQVILPLSPNHGVFGGDGLYGESKLALETLFDRWHSEGWQDYLSICGAVIGWTRGTGLMNQNDLVAEGIESAGMRTFSQEEMAYALVGLCVQSISELCQEQPLYADLTGRMAEMQSLPEKLRSLRQELTERSEIQAALLAESVFEQECSTAATPRSEPQPTQPEQRAHVRLDFPKPLDYEQDIHHLHADLHGMVDLDRTVVVTGFSELGPLGNARTRWEMEAYGRFSLEGTIEMAWLMGYIRHYAGTIDGAPYSGWVDAETKKPVADVDVKALYEERILSHTGIRLIESEQKPFLHEVILQEDLEPLQVPEALAQQMKSEHGAFAAVRSSATPDLCTVQLLKGARLFIPRAMQSNQPVGGLIPTGWDPRTYGIPEEIVSQVDRVTLFTLVCTVEALLSSGITDPYELYQYMHVSEVGICIGSGMGGVTSLEKMFKGRQTSPEDIPKDILQETFVNTTGAWVNMLLLSASGPLRTPVGACATALESLELGYDTIVTGKARFCLVGGCDDVTNETSQEFANMKATSNPEEELAKGRAPHEMSRPATSTRSGFVESHGAGLQVLTTATLALKMGLPIRGIIAFASTSSDKAGRSVPAPGKGVLTNAKHVASTVPAPLMNIRSRRKRLEFRLRQIAEARDIALQDLDFEVAAVVAQDPTVDVDAYVQARRQQIVEDFTLEQKDTRFRLGNEFWRNNPQIAPLAGALATWGLTIDDLGVASFHGTSTVLNDKNESSVIQQQLRSLGRRPGNLILSVFQKALTGHSKGAAGAWMLNGALQMLDTGLVPGNRNADNIDPALKEFDLVAYLHRPIRVHELKAVSVTSFGFGQKGAQALCVHPRYLFATLPKDEYLAYTARCTRRQRKADMFFYEAMNENSLFRAKTAPPFAPAQETATYLDPTVRFP